MAISDPRQAGSSSDGTRSAVVFVALLLTATAACRPAAPEQRYELKGKVTQVDQKGRTVTVYHEAIPGYMEAMIMPFKLRDERLLNDLAEGDRLQATLVVAGLRSWLDDVVVMRETVDPSNLGKAESGLEPRPGDEVPDFELVDQNGKRLSFHQYRGRTVVLTFIYTRCPLPDYCPLMTDNFAEIERALKSDPQLKTHLLSITLDPEYDTPKVLREYAAAHSADTAQWNFATGTKDEVKRIATYFGLQYWRDADQVVHSLRTAIVGADGRFVKLYRGNEWKPEEIVRAVHNLGEPGEVVSENIHRGVGIVDSLDRERATVQLDHEDIKDVMPAMNMPYAVKDKSVLDSIAPGDKVDFWLESTPGGLIVVRIEKR